MVLRLGVNDSVIDVCSTQKSNFTCSLNIYVDKSGVIDVAITSLTTTSIIKYLEKFNNVNISLWIHSHSATMEFIWKSFEIVRCTKPRVEFSSIRNPVSVVGISIWRSRTLIVLGNGTYPDWNTKSDISMIMSKIVSTCSETCVLDVVQILAKTVGGQHEVEMSVLWDTYEFQVPPHHVRVPGGHWLGSAPSGKAYLSMRTLQKSYNQILGEGVIYTLINWTTSPLVGRSGINKRQSKCEKGSHEKHRVWHNTKQKRAWVLKSVEGRCQRRWGGRRVKVGWNV